MDRLETVMELRRGSRLGRVSCLAARAATCVIIPRMWGVGTRRIGAKVRSHHRSRSPARANIRVTRAVFSSCTGRADLLIIN